MFDDVPRGDRVHWIFTRDSEKLRAQQAVCLVHLPWRGQGVLRLVLEVRVRKKKPVDPIRQAQKNRAHRIGWAIAAAGIVCGFLLVWLAPAA